MIMRKKYSYSVTQTLYFYQLEYRILRNQNRLTETMFLAFDFNRQLKKQYRMQTLEYFRTGTRCGPPKPISLVEIREIL